MRAMMSREIHFFIGKGGVGKSTTSALTAVHLAHKGYNTLLCSMDPAHNQRDIFDRHFYEKPKQVNRNLAVKEVDADYWISKYLKETEVQIKKVYSYQSAFNIQNYFNILKYSPGLEEYALLLAFENILDTAKDRDFIIFDMAPTALTMRFFSLPFITLVWLKELLKLRKNIYTKKEIISKIKLGRKEIEQDKVKAKLEELINDNQHLQEYFTARETKINLVVNNDRLSFSEAVRTKQKLTKIGIPINRVVVNKVQNNEITESLRAEFNDYKMTLFPLASGGLLGLETLQLYLDKNQNVLNDLP
ncbi:MAG: ArsA family ATPase [Deltaproteobacteria bacterium]|nr:MAG: ArsA family ATPase [Deltaproteobacteria bacterium]